MLVLVSCFGLITCMQDEIAKDPDTHGSTFIPVILGSDKMTVSVATGQNDYYPLYASIGNVRNNVRRAHRNAVVVVGFLAMPKSMYSSMLFVIQNFVLMALHTSSNQTAFSYCWLQKLQTAIVSLLTGLYPQEHCTWHDQTRSHMIW